ncbi:MAG: CDP-diacylglycerol--glycerol-3-phosphate 3-phosphatidyltransferase [Gammaproteobacteria bacterium]|nr:CDP-diacylglycerol--glycerol-3-phosphate 3-phosphatidyltransferase [Gammaproteobacteria bacterium]
MSWNLPLLLTAARIGVIPAILLLMLQPSLPLRHIAAVLFVLAAVTDWLDGWLARRWSQTTLFGAFLDPVADKLLVAVSLVMLLRDRPTDLLALLVAVTIGREITVSALREWLAEVGQRARVAVNQIGKVKTAAQMSAIALLLWGSPLFGLPAYTLGLLLLVLAAVLTLWSMLVYLRGAWPYLRGA